jgi:hypothetical protein
MLRIGIDMLTTSSYTQIIESLDTIKQEFERLLERPNVAPKAGAKQWNFFRHAAGVLFGTRTGDYACSARRAANYKHEVNQRLGSYYGAPGAPVPFRFLMAPRQQALAQGLVGAEYPSANGYVVLVEQWSPELRSDADRERDAIERALMEVLDAEWTVYTRVPEVDLSPLKGKVAEGTRMYRVIQELVERKSRARSTICNAGNPSNKRLLKVNVERFGEERAEVRTREYWLLEWWSLSLQEYDPVYRETNRQRYTFVKQDGRWLATRNEYPPPKLSPYRAKRAG